MQSHLLANHRSSAIRRIVMSRIAAPMVGGMISSTLLTLAVIPAIYALTKQWQLQRSTKGGTA